MTEVLWRWLDREGHESAQLRDHTLRGAAAIKNGEDVCGLAYTIECDEQWRTVRAEVNGFVGDQQIAVSIEAADGRWMMNGTHVPDVEGCIDVDLNFSPSTNLLPIRRLDLAVGQTATVRAAWLRFPTFTLEPIDQTYHRTGERTYQYKSASFTAEITVNEAGLVVEYGPWQAV